MTDYPTDVHGPAATAPTVSDEYATCALCNVQWQIRGDSDKKGCQFCGAGQEAVTVHRED